MMPFLLLFASILIGEAVSSGVDTCPLPKSGAFSLSTCQVQRTYKTLEKFLPDRFSNNSAVLQQVNLLSSNYTVKVNDSKAVGKFMSNSTKQLVKDLKEAIDTDNISNNVLGRRRRSAPNEKCYSRGDEDPSSSSQQLLMMCGMCSQTTHLGPNFFPTYINEVVCKQENGCLYGEGLCDQNVIFVEFKRNPNGNTYGKESYGEWESYQQPIRVSCQCKIRAASPFKNYVMY